MGGTTTQTGIRPKRLVPVAFSPGGEIITEQPRQYSNSPFISTGQCPQPVLNGGVHPT
jgi:hypothetical protein